eukprot:Awhi_evm3s4625
MILGRVNGYEWLRTPQISGTDGVYNYNVSGTMNKFACAAVYMELFEDGTFDNDKIKAYISDKDLKAATGASIPVTLNFDDKGTMNIDLKFTPWETYAATADGSVPNTYFDMVR